MNKNGVESRRDLCYRAMLIPSGTDMFMEANQSNHETGIHAKTTSVIMAVGKSL